MPQQRKSQHRFSRAGARCFRAVLLPVAALLCLSVLPSLPGCSSKPPVVPQTGFVKAGSSPDAVTWAFAPNALLLHIKSDGELNFEDEQPHTVMICVYQMDDPSVFQELAQNEDGLAKLLTCQRFDKSFKAVSRRIVPPGAVDSIPMDRAEGAKQVGIVAGYHKLVPGGMTRTWAVPLSVETKGMLFWKEPFYYPAPLEMILVLGASGIEKLDEDSDGGK